MKKTTKTRTPKTPTTDSQLGNAAGPLTPEGEAKLRKLLPRCQQLGTTIAAAGPIAALLYFEGITADQKPAHARIYGKALDAVEKAHGDTPTLRRLDEAHGAALGDTSEEAFLAGYFAGLAAAAGAR